MTKPPSNRVLFIASQPFFQWRGSPIRLGFDLMSLSQLGYEVEFLTLPIGEPREIPGVKIVRAPNPFHAKKISIGPSPLKLFFDFLLFWMALGRVIKRRYAVVHGVEDCGIVALVCARFGRAKMVFERHSDPASYKKKKGLGNLVLKMYAAVERFVMRHADAVIGTGPGLVENAVKVRRDGRACLIPDIPSSLEPADPDATAAIRAKYVRDADDIIIGYVGSFAVYQGIDLLFDAIPLVVHKVPKARFAIIGGSQTEIAACRARLEAAHCPDAATFIGFVDPDKLPSYLASFDILLSPRISGMNTPLKLLDYLKANVPIVATDCEANRLILDKTTAELTPLTPDGFANGIVRLCTDPARREALAGAGQDILRAHHSFPVFKDGLRKCYEYVLSVK